MWTVDQWAGLLGAFAVVITAVAGLTAAIAQLAKSWQRTDDKPAPEVGIPAAPQHDDIDYRAYEEMRRDRDFWRNKALGEAEHIDEDTQPQHPTT